MPELRWTLAVLGALFIIGLAIWELRRQRQAPGQGAGAERFGSPLEGSAEGGVMHREPTITFPELHPEPADEPALTASRREPAHDPPIIEVEPDSFSRLPVQGEAVDPLAGMETLRAPASDETRTQMDGRTDAAPSAWMAERMPEAASKGTHADRHEPSISLDDAHEQDTWDTQPEPRAPESHAAPHDRPAETSEATDASVGFVSDFSADDDDALRGDGHHESPVDAGAAPGAAGAATNAPIVDWPDEALRRIVALRLVSPPGARFSGRTVRQALLAEGFVFGKFDIFHKPGPDDRVLLSAANLTKPGTFTLSTMDSQRFGGLSLFTVLPGPLPPQQAFDELLSTARNLNDRLQGALQDERGEPLTPTRSASIRQSLADFQPSGSPVAVTEPQVETHQ